MKRQKHKKKKTYDGKKENWKEDHLHIQDLLQKYTLNSTKSLYRPIVAIYMYYKIEILEIPPINKNRVIIHESVTYKDLPDKQIIRKALKITTLLMQAAITLWYPVTVPETLNLTVWDYIDDLSKHTTKKVMPMQKNKLHNKTEWLSLYTTLLQNSVLLETNWLLQTLNLFYFIQV